MRLISVHTAVVLCTASRSCPFYNFSFCFLVCVDMPSCQSTGTAALTSNRSHAARKQLESAGPEPRRLREASLPEARGGVHLPDAPSSPSARMQASSSGPYVSRNAGPERATAGDTGPPHPPVVHQPGYDDDPTLAPEQCASSSL